MQIPIRNPAATFTRPADTTAYTSGDLVANSTTAGLVAPMEFQVSRSRDGSLGIIRGRIKKSGTGVTNASFRIHLYSSSPTPTNGDNGAWVTTNAGYLGFIDVAVDKAFSDAAQGDGVPISASVAAEMAVKLAGTTTKIFGLLEARGAYTPANAEVFTVTLEVVPQT